MEKIDSFADLHGRVRHLLQAGQYEDAPALPDGF
jgi:hypothetical protein